MMEKLNKPIRRALPWVYAIALHAAVAALLFLGIEWGMSTSGSGRTKNAPKKNVVQATVVSQADVNKQLAQIKAAQAAKKRRQEAAQEKLEAQAEAAKKSREQEQAKLAELKHRHQAEQAAETAHQAKLKQQREAKKKAEATAQAKLEKQHEAEKKKATEHLAEVKQQAQAEQQRLAKLKAEREAAEKKQAEEERRVAEAKKKAAEAAREKKEAAERAREEKLAQQKAQATAQMKQEMASEQQARDASLIKQYQTLISQKITRNWVRPASARQHIDCTVEVEQIPGGEVVKAQVTACNANGAVRQSIETAVYKASPLPPPPAPSVFSRQLEIHFNPGGQ
jgi:colicin import membrane protein